MSCQLAVRGVSRRLCVAGGGIGGLSASLAASRTGWQVRLLEQTDQLSEAGAGIQLGPNATRVLRSWDLLDAVRARACAPQRIVARDAGSGRELGSLSLGEHFVSRYGAPYLTIHRADLQSVLLQAVRAAGVEVRTGVQVRACVQSVDAVRLHMADGECVDADAVVAADGLWSALRQRDGPPLPSGHVAYRALVSQADLPFAWRRPEVCAWLGSRLHAVTYPVRAGEALNVVVVVQQATEGDATGWDHPAAAARLQSAVGHLRGPLAELIERVPRWGLWVLHDRHPVAGPTDMARGRIALLGDAAHPMRPYLAQGAAMALEDARELARVLARAQRADVAAALQDYAQSRWQRCARVQRRSLRNGAIFHAAGALRLARDVALRAMGNRLMDVPWLYAG